MGWMKDCPIWADSVQKRTVGVTPVTVLLRGTTPYSSGNRARVTQGLNTLAQIKDFGVGTPHRGAESMSSKSLASEGLGLAPAGPLFSAAVRVENPIIGERQ